MSYPYPYHLLPFKTYQEWFDADWKSLIHCVHNLQNQCVYLESSYATPYQQYDNMLDFLSDDCIRQINDIRHELLDIRLALLCNEELSTLLRLQWNGSTKSNLQNCSLFSPFNLSAHTFAMYTLPFDRISFILDLLSSNKIATCDLLVLDQINQTIVNLEWQLDKNHCLAAQRFSALLQHWLAQQIPQRIHDAQQLDCGRCRLCHQQPTPFQLAIPSSSDSASSSSFLTRNRHWQMPSYPRRSNSNPVASTSWVAPTYFSPLTTWSGQVYPWDYFAEHAADVLCCLQTVLEERRWGTVDFPIVVEDPEAEDDIFMWYYHWFINKGCD